MINNKLRNRGTTLLETLVGLLITSLLVVLVAHQQLLQFQLQIDARHRLDAYLAAIDFAERAGLAQAHRRRRAALNIPTNFVCALEACSARLEDPTEWNAWVQGLKKNLPHPSWAVQTTQAEASPEFGPLLIRWGREAPLGSLGNACTLTSPAAHRCITLPVAW